MENIFTPFWGSQKTVQSQANTLTNLVTSILKKEECIEK